MSDLIDRQYALEHYQHVCRRTSCKECPMHIKSTDVLDTFTDCEIELFLYNLPSAQPTAEVVERKKGKWKMTDAFPHWLYCDQCFKRIVPNANWIEEYNIPTNWCPNCGADMRKETEDE